MFTGIITDIGRIASIEKRADTHMKIHCHYDMDTVDIGASIACSGVCLTVVDKSNNPADSDKQNWFSVDISDETISCTAKQLWNEGAKLNLERSLKVGDELGGHIVSGHVDGVGEIIQYENIGGSWALTIAAPSEIAAYIAPKGSITINGISLTVNNVTDKQDGSCHFMLNIIPHTAEVTTLADAKTGDQVNLEIDVLARYMKRMMVVQPA